MKLLAIAACAALLSGCAAGLGVGQHWEKADAKPGEYDSTVNNCIALMKGQPPVYDSDFHFVQFVPGYTLGQLSQDYTARKQFSRDCMMAQGWAAK